MTPSVVEIVERVAKYFRMTPDQLLDGQCSKRPIARRVAMYLAHEECGLTYAELAYEFERCEHTTGEAVRRIRFGLRHRPNSMATRAVEDLGAKVDAAE